jgi:DNA polymerase (family 10)
MKNRGEFVKKLSEKIVLRLRPYCRRIKIAGSIRRKEKNPRDIDIVLIPKNKEKISEVMKKFGRFVEGGEKKLVFRIDSVQTELYFTTPQSWGGTLLAYSSRKGSAIGLRVIARIKGFKLNQYGLFRKGKLVAGRSEEAIYRALGRKFKPPEKR